MFYVELTCGEAPCEVTTVVVDTLEELDAFVCDECGYCLHVLSVSGAEWVELEPRVELLMAA